MIAVSSLRPLGDSPEYDANQIAAWQSWTSVFEAIVYLNEPQPQLAHPKVRFYPAEPYPRILDLVEICASQTDWCCLINADICIPPHFRQVEQKLKLRNAQAAVSWRFEFDPAVGWFPNERVDSGQDFFAAVPDVWKKMYEEIPEGLKMATQEWDAWVLGFFAAHVHRGYYDLSNHRLILHPKHGGRKYGTWEGPFHFHAWPTMPCEYIR